MDKLSLLKRNLDKKNISARHDVERPSQALKYFISFGLSFFVFVVVSWPPFYGYMYLKSYLDGFNFSATHVSVDIQEAVWFFFVGASDIWLKVPIFIDFTFKISFVLSLLVVVVVILALKNEKKWDEYNLKKDIFNLAAWFNSNKIRKYITASIISGLLTFLFLILIYLIPVAIIASLFLFAILGDLHGREEAHVELIEKPCIYASPESNCSLVRINHKDKLGYIAYLNENNTFFINHEGSYHLNEKGRVVQFRPFKISQINGLGSETFIPEKWMANIKDRSAMLNDFIANNKDNLTAELVFKSMGDSDVKFHYKEFPAYRLSSTSTCSVGFPFNWETKEIVNVVQFGNCKN